MGKTIAQSWLEEGIKIGFEKGFIFGFEIGFEQGRIIGRADSLRSAIERIGRKRFGEPVRWAHTLLQSISNENRLDHVQEVSSWVELFSNDETKS